jgi:hypothetical protein
MECLAQTGLVGTACCLDRATLSALVVMDVHARDVVSGLATEAIEGQPQHFSWLSQLRMYWEQLPEEEQASIIIRMMNAQVGVPALTEWQHVSADGGQYGCACTTT